MDVADMRSFRFTPNLIYRESLQLILRSKMATLLPRIRSLTTMRLLILVLLALSFQLLPASDFHATACEGSYNRHVQGICTNGQDAIYWCWTDVLVKTDTQGRILKQVPVADHHGDLCYHNGRVYVATNLGKFNRPAGSAYSWVYVYDGDTLAELAKHAVPELVHGAGGMAYHDGKFIIVGGLPPDVNENYLYEYDEAFRFQKRHVLASGYTLKGIQTAAYADGAWWFGCYGKPQKLLRADENFRLTGQWTFNASVGIVPISGGRFLMAENTVIKGKGNEAKVFIARPDEKTGFQIEKP